MDIKTQLMETQMHKERTLLQGMRDNAPELRSLFDRVNHHWGYEDGMYRFYHGSFKVYDLQRYTLEMATLLTKIAPEGRPFCTSFSTIIAAGTKKKFALEVNGRWDEETIPITTAFLHARYFLEMAVKYIDSENPPELMPSGWAALLCLYGIR